MCQYSLQFRASTAGGEKALSSLAGHASATQPELNQSFDVFGTSLEHIGIGLGQVLLAFSEEERDRTAGS